MQISTVLTIFVAVFFSFCFNSCFSDDAADFPNVKLHNENANNNGAGFPGVGLGGSSSLFIVTLCYDAKTNKVTCTSELCGKGCPCENELTQFFSTVSEADALAQCRECKENLKYIRCQNPTFGSPSVTCRPKLAGCQTDQEGMMPRYGVYSSQANCENAQKIYYPMLTGKGNHETDRIGFDTRICNFYGGQLATTESQAEFNQLINTPSFLAIENDLKARNRVLWVGALRMNAVWRWINGNDNIVAINFLDPINYPGASSCAFLHWSQVGWHYDPISCSSQFPAGYMCETYTVL